MKKIMAILALSASFLCAENIFKAPDQKTKHQKTKQSLSQIKQNTLQSVHDVHSSCTMCTKELMQVLDCVPSLCLQLAGETDGPFATSSCNQLLAYQQEIETLKKEIEQLQEKMHNFSYKFKKSCEG